MRESNHSSNHDGSEDSTFSAKLERRSFLRFAGVATATTALAATGCSKVDDIFHIFHPSHAADMVDLGSGDIGILNYAYALEQLEAAFYTIVVDIHFAGMKDWEYKLIKDVRDHEIAHREFFKTALGSKAIGKIEVNFDSIHFRSRDSVLATAKAFEDLGVTAYNGAGQLLKTPAYLTLAGKIVSVEARHAAFFRELIKTNTFSSEADSNGMDMARTPKEVLAIAGNYIKTKIDASHLPTS